MIKDQINTLKYGKTQKLKIGINSYIKGFIKI